MTKVKTTYTPNISKNVDQLELVHLTGGNVKGMTTLGDSWAVSSVKLLPHNPKISLLGIHCREMETPLQKALYDNNHFIFIHNSSYIWITVKQ